MVQLVAENVTLTYPMAQGNRNIRSELMRMFKLSMSSNKTEKLLDINALKNISFTLKSGDRVGLIGGNGAGKSTLLKILGGIYKPTSGRVSVEGEIQMLLSLGGLFDLEETGWENIDFFCAFRGLSLQQSKIVKEDVEAFCELGSFLDYPLRTYSTGMRTRLAFSLATTLSPKILLLDEIVGAGDARFFKKAEARMRDLTTKTEILVLASHSNTLIEAWCNKAIWLDKGKISSFGPVKEIVELYNATI